MLNLFRKYRQLKKRLEFKEILVDILWEYVDESSTYEIQQRLEKIEQEYPYE